MRLKGINPIERHIEKLVLVVFSLALLALLVLQFLGEPNAVEVNGRTVPPESAREIVRDAALRAKGQLDSIEPAPELAGDLTDYAGPFERALRDLDVPELASGALGESTLVRADSPGGLGTGDGIDVADAKPLYVPEPPLLASPMVAPFEGAVHPLVGAKLAGRLPALREQPYDLRGVSVQASFDAPALRTDLNNPPSSHMQLPLDWSRNIQILDVQLWRERQDAEGGWTDRTLVEAMPERGSLRDRLAPGAMRPAELPNLLDAERERRSQIRAPRMYPMVAGLPWVAPAEFPNVKRTLPDQQQVNRILSTLDSINTEIERLSARSENISDTESRQAQRLAREIERAQGDREGIIDQLRALGVDENGDAIDFDEESPDRAFTVSRQNLLDESSPIKLMAHDVTCEPGETYRYMVRVLLTNPLFGRQTRLIPEQKDQAESLTLAADSGWSDEIHVPESMQFFVLDATPGSVTNGIEQPASVRVLASRFYYGYWRTAEARVRVGSPVHADATLPALWTWSIEQDDEGETVTGETVDGPTTLPIRTMSLLLGVDPAISDSLSALDTLVYIHSKDGEPTTRSPSTDRGRNLLAMIRFSASQGQNAALPEVPAGSEGQ